MKKLRSIVPITSMVSLALLLGANAFGKDRLNLQGSISLKGKSKSQYPALATLTMQEAIARASEQASGRIVESALENEGGYLVYSIEVVGSDQIKRELLIDAGNGKVLLTKSDRDDDEDGDRD